MQAQQTLFVAGLVQLVDQGRSGGEADRETLLAGGQPVLKRNHAITIGLSFGDRLPTVAQQFQLARRFL